jgi:hypothetical protein
MFALNKIAFQPFAIAASGGQMRKIDFPVNLSGSNPSPWGVNFAVAFGFDTPRSWRGVIHLRPARRLS